MAKHKYIETPERLWDLFCEYVEHERQNPMFKTEYVGKDGGRVNTPLEVPITFDGFECYLADKGVISDLSHYSANTDGAYDEYRTIITRVRKNCYVHNFKGAAVGLFNANLISKKLGLTDKKELQHKGLKIEIVEVDEDSTDEEAD
jgi:hypothetical protein